MASLPRGRLSLFVAIVLVTLIILLFNYGSTPNRVSRAFQYFRPPTSSPLSRSETPQSIVRETGGEGRAVQKPSSHKFSKFLSIIDLSVPINATFQRAVLKTSRGNTPIFVYTTNKDMWVSGAIMKSGAWEGGMVTAWQTLLSKLPPSATVVDVGANLGQYGLAALVMKRRAVFVEPVLNNARRIAKSVQAGPQDFRRLAVVLQNALSDSRRRILFRTFKGNVGGTQILDEKHREASDKTFGSAYAVILNDLVGVVPGEDVLMKVDAECSEQQVLNKSSEFFSRYRVHAILMEWHGCTANSETTPHFITAMAKFGFRPYEIAAEPKVVLDASKARKSWPGDILWVNERLNLLIPAKKTT